MASSIESGLAHAENFVPEDEVLCAARRRGTEFGATPVSPGAGAALRFLAAAIQARSVVEVGTGCGVSGLWLLRGMRPGSALTSVDAEPEHQRLAREAFTEAGFTGGRVRLIAGRAVEVLPRLTDGAYDMVFCDAPRREYPDYLDQAMRLLRPGGVLAFDRVLWNHDVADPAQRDPDTVAARELGKLVRDDDRLMPVMLPLSDGLLAAIKS